MQLSFQDFLYNNIFLKSTLHAARKRIFWKQQTEKPDITRMKVQYKAKITLPPLWSPKRLPDHQRNNEPSKVAFLEFSLSSKKKSLFPETEKAGGKKRENCIAINCSDGGIARIELATSCTLSKNHTTRPNARITFCTQRTTKFLQTFSCWRKWRYSVFV